jgi:mono/diheme cytochrome c family protein
MAKRERPEAMGRTAWLTVALALLAGCAREDWPAAFAPSRYTMAQLGNGRGSESYVPLAPLAEAIQASMREQYGVPAAPAVKSANAGRNAAILRGSRAYRVNCMYCHGMNGDGAGPSANNYDPRPRDYRRGAFKWKSTLANAKPLRSDLKRTLLGGVTGTAMPPFKLLADDQLDDLVEYVVYLAERGEAEYSLLYKAQQEAPDKPEEIAKFLKEDWPETVGEQFGRVAQSWQDDALAKQLVPVAGTRIDDRAPAAAFGASVDRGRGVFLGAGGCVKCHGLDGKGGARDLKADDDANVDLWGRPIQPRNLKEGVFRGGRAPIDLYRRIHQGIAPSKMPASGAVLKPDQIWDLVNFLRTLPYRPELLPPAAGPSAP